MRARDIARIRALQARKAEMTAATRAREAREAAARAAEQHEVAQLTMKAWANALGLGHLDLAVIDAWPVVAAATKREAERRDALVVDAGGRRVAGLVAFATASLLAEKSNDDAASAETEFRRRRDEKQTSIQIELLSARTVE